MRGYNAYRYLPAGTATARSMTASPTGPWTPSGGRTPVSVHRRGLGRHWL